MPSHSADRSREEVSDSRFHMWRAVFAVAHADNFLALEEQGLLSGYLDKVPFSKDQLALLREDMASPQSIEEMFLKISDPADRDGFFDLARRLVWADGMLDEREKALVERLSALCWPGDAPAVQKTEEADGKGCCASRILDALVCRMRGGKGDKA